MLKVSQGHRFSRTEKKIPASWTGNTAHADEHTQDLFRPPYICSGGFRAKIEEFTLNKSAHSAVKITKHNF